MRWLIVLLTSLAVATLIGARPAQAAPSPQQDAEALWQWDQDVDGHLPRWREGGPPPDDPNQSLHPRAVSLVGTADVSGPPTSGLIASPPEYGPTDGVVFRYHPNSWASVVSDCVGALTGDPAHDDKAYVIVGSESHMNDAIARFTSKGADLSKVVFMFMATDSIWLRDYGPHFIWQSSAKAIVDSHYYPSRPLDNYVPYKLATQEFDLPPYHMGLYYSGGNFQPGPNRSGFVTSLINNDNPEMTNTEVAALYQDFQGIDTLHIMPKLPGSVDGTGHIDMWFYIVDEDDVIISEFKPGSNQTAIDITENAVPYMQSLGFDVHRTPAWNSGGVHYTYTNAFRVNDRIFTISYAQGNPNYLLDDRNADLAWEAAAGPGVEIIPINCYSIIPAAGAIHCIVMQVPEYIESIPAAHVVTPDGHEVLVAGNVQDLFWTACDDVDEPTIDLSYSIDGGVTYPYAIASGEANDGHYDWTIPADLSTAALVKVTATDGSANSIEAVSETPFEICDDNQTVYDFSTGAGVDRWAWGHTTPNWTSLDGIRYPAGASTEVDSMKADAYLDLAVSDATGNDNDANRYISNLPGGGSESTHVFEFTLYEDPADMHEIAIAWEGYGDQCMQMELYVWDDVAGNWGDLEGEYGLNRYASNHAGNRDDLLVGHITGDFERYVDGNGRLTFLVYADRSGQESFHDYVSVTVTWRATPAVWTDVGNALAGAYGEPLLVGNGALAGGDQLVLTMSGALENAPATLFVGLTRIDAPFKGGVLVPAPDLLVPGLVTDAGGNLVLSSTWPVGLPSGFTTHLQYWVNDPVGPVGLSASNGVSAIVP
jgi:agmatine/peptidylarginine deiminase